MRAGSRVRALLLGGLLAVACAPATTEDPAPDPAREGSGGRSGTGGRPGGGSGGPSPAPGGNGGSNAPGSGGAGGGSDGTGGAQAGSGGVPAANGGGSGGAPAANGGAGGSFPPGGKDGSAGDVSPSPGGDASGEGPSAPTFTTIWTELLMPTCGTGACHARKAPPQGIDMHTAMLAYKSLLAKVVVKNEPGKSKLVALIEAKKMPPGGKPAVSVAQLADLKAWISAGALEN